MPKRAAFLTDKQVRSLRLPGLYAVGGLVPGLALQVTQTPGNDIARSWVLRAMLAGRRRAFGLGPYPALSLAAARQKAVRMHSDIRDNRDPGAIPASRRADAAAASARETTFKQAAEQYIEERRPSCNTVQIEEHR
jgi:Arm DNA-binding domain